MKKIMCILGLVVGVYYGIIQVRLESPVFQKQIDSAMENLGRNFFPVGERVDDGYNFVKADVVPNVKQNFATYLAGIAVITSTLILRSRGKSTPQALKSAFLHMPDPVPVENPVVVRARNKTLRMQLLSDQIGVQNRLKSLPEKITAAQKDASYAQNNYDKAKDTLTKATKIVADAVDYLNALTTQKADLETEMVHLQDELSKLENA